MAATQQLTPNQIVSNNQSFLTNALRRNRTMPDREIKSAGQVIDIQLEQVPGWADKFTLPVYVDLAVTVAAGGTAPSWSEMFPWNLFSSVELSLGGGPFQRVSPFFYALRKKAMNPGWKPGMSAAGTFGYAANVAWDVPAISATAGSTTDNYARFTMEVPLQAAHGLIAGHLPLGDATITAKLRLTVASNLYGSDHYENPVVGGTSVTVAIGTAQTSTVGVDISYRTTPATRTQVPDPIVGQVLNIQEQVTPITGTGADIPIYFKNPFLYLRLWHVLIDGTGAPDSSDVTNFELDLFPGLPQFEYNTPASLQAYYEKINSLYRGDLDTGVFVFDMWSGNDPVNPNGDQMIDGTLFQTLQTRMRLASGASVGSSAKIITYAEALSPVNF